MAQKPGRTIRWKLTVTAAGACAVLVVAAGLLFIDNRRLPTSSQVVERLGPLEKSRLAEALHLKQTLGESVWPGWGQAEIPVLAWNERYGFLVGESNPPPGWEVVPGEAFLGKPYHRTPSPTREAFAVRIGEHWAAGIATMEWMQISFVRDLGGKLPGFLRPVFPSRLVAGFLGLTSADVHIALVLHESLHAYQADKAPSRFDEAQKAYGDESRYPWDDAELQGSWKAELALLVQAVSATSDNDAAMAARRFLDQRRERRRRHALHASLVNFERQMEWLEGLAKYVELAVWREASLRHDYKPLAELAGDRSFRGYATFPRRWSTEMTTMTRQASSDGDIRFYYTGMAQAFLLDRLSPGWHARVFDTDVWLEGLLGEACASPGWSRR